MDITQCINYLLSVSQNKVFKYFSVLLEEHNLTPAQYGVLNCLWSEGELSPKQIGGMMHLEASTVSGILDKMQKAGFIERSIDPENRRNILVVPTPKAIAIQKDVEATTERLNQTVLQDLSDSDQQTLKKLLGTIIQSDFN
ncbi:MarR family winged helix-turn-helix transcriptional regulator [Planococcus halocryophilus]|uniref:MarR family winged helix-turn-helix transcriptional regulator n=1 Tax=Planococcus halocryophilus TaxID=1215089 RepID=UPI001F103BB0|nr:MarR family transcriptional regulator [Planococcus halocryophilus]MCH4825330.1 MarR family transcriptional regulator [Planococcus halocryophilus]